MNDGKDIDDRAAAGSAFGGPPPYDIEAALAACPVDRAALRWADFEHLVGTEFEVAGHNGSLLMILVEGREIPRAQGPGARRVPFGMLFRPAGDGELTGHNFDLRHPELGVLPFVLFTRVISPPDHPAGAYYEVIFA